MARPGAGTHDPEEAGGEAIWGLPLGECRDLQQRWDKVSRPRDMEQAAGKEEKTALGGSWLLGKQEGLEADPKDIQLKARK